MNRLIAFALLLAAGVAHAQTSTPPEDPDFHYRAKCRMNQGNAFKFDGTCAVSFRKRKEGSFLRAWVEPPEGSKPFEVRLYPKHTATIDGAPASVELLNGLWHISASDGNDLWITVAPKDVLQQ